MSDQDVDNFLEHFGVMGMKWGIRRDRRANRYRKVGFGLGNKSEKLRSYASLGPVDLIRGRGYKGGAARRGERLLNSNQRIKAGKTKARDVLTFVASTKYQDMFPTSKSSTNTKAAIGTSIAAVALVNIGKTYMKQRGMRAAFG
jgi:hypothetical protein